jgi:hypothetical protein
MWYPEELFKHESLGSLAERPGSLGNLHETRSKTLSQFFTPLWIVEKVYDAVSHCKKEKSSLISILDNSCGSGRWFAHANKDSHSLYGVDIEPTAIEKLEHHVGEAGFTHEFITASMVDIRLGDFDIGMINPPFSINLQSPFIKPVKGVTAYGKFGPDTSCVSHAYALAQALYSCTVVTALIPHSLTQSICNGEFPKAKKHLTHIYKLPKAAFLEEGVAAVECDLCIFDTTITTKTFKTLPLDKSLSLEPITVDFNYTRPMLINRHIDISQPVVTEPVTKQNTVTLSRKGNSVHLGFNCGLMKAKVMNAIYRERLVSDNGHRYPQNTKYRGQHLLDLYVLSSQDTANEGLVKLKKTIECVGGLPVISRCVFDGIKAIRRREEKQSAAFSQTVYKKTIVTLSATAKRFGLLGKSAKDGIVKIGDKAEVTRTDNGFIVVLENSISKELEHDQFFNLFSLPDESNNVSDWVVKHEPLALTYPEHFLALDTKAKSLGLDKWLSFSDYQYADLLELAFKPRGALCAWEMGLGKARLSLALCMMGGQHNLLVVKSRLVDEMVIEIKGLGVDASQYQVIKSASDCLSLKKINIISYERAKATVGKHKKLSIAKLLRNRIHTLCADEGGVLSNRHSIQTRAIWEINPKKRFGFDGTPIANYVRQFLPVACWVMGESRPSQPYSLGGEHFYPNLISGAKYQRRGLQAFSDNFVCLDWATNEFSDTLTSGAKREIPKIKDVGEFRSWAAGIIKRRVQQEPDVKRYVNFPIPTLHPAALIDWDYDHLTHYIGVVQWFGDWYKKELERAKGTGKKVNLAVVLAKLDAVFKAVNRPENMGKYPVSFHGNNTKDDWSVELIQQEVEKGNRTILYARNPLVLHRLAIRLNKLGISNLVFTGEEDITKRNKKLEAEFRNGDKQVLLASLGAAQDGLNLHQANTVIFFNRSFKSREEFQAIARVLRPLQKKEVDVYYGHLVGSLDEYQGQMVDWKHQSCLSGLDYGEFDPEHEDFVHYDTFFERFINSADELIEMRKNIGSLAA